MSEQRHDLSAQVDQNAELNIFYRPSPQTLASWTVNRMPVQVDLDTAVSSLGCDACSCVLAGTQILLADGTSKSIETMVAGDVVRTLSGISRIRGVERLRLGVTRRVIEMRSGSQPPLLISDEHAMWTRFDKDGTQFDWWGVYNFNHYLVEKENGHGVGLERDALPLRFDIPQTHAHIDGWKHVQPIYHLMHPDTALYHLDVEQGGSYIAGGFVISSHACDQDGENVVWQGVPQGQRALAEDFVSGLLKA